MEVIILEKNKSEFKKWLILIAVAIIGYWGINNLNVVGSLFNTIFDILFPFIFGGCLAFVLNIPMAFFERKLSITKKKYIKNPKILRVISIIFAVLVIFCVLTLIINLIVPELVNIGKLLIDNIPYYVQETSKFIEKYGKDIINSKDLLEMQSIDFDSIKDQILNSVFGLLSSSISIVTNIVGTIADILIGIVFSIYLLMDKEKLQTQTKKVLYAYVSKDKADKIIRIGNVFTNTFKSFFTVQCLEAMILGTLCIIGMLILKIPYAVPIGILIGVTALIPVVGAFIGMIIGAILIVSVEPIKVIAFVIFILILQQIEGNLIYPRVVGNSLGLPGMWVLVAVTVGGSLGGIIGMLIGVPIASAIYKLLQKDVEKKQKNLTKKEEK